jgi:hypothetical protein
MTLSLQIALKANLQSLCEVGFVPDFSERVSAHGRLHVTLLP